MRSLPVEKIVLGFILAVISTIISSITTTRDLLSLPHTNSRNNGTLIQYSGGDNIHQPILTCRIGAFVPRCHFTEISATTDVVMFGTIIFDADGHFYDTQGNTSISYPDVQIDTTSYMIPIA